MLATIRPKEQFPLWIVLPGSGWCGLTLGTKSHPSMHPKTVLNPPPNAISEKNGGGWNSPHGIQYFRTPPHRGGGGVDNSQDQGSELSSPTIVPEMPVVAEFTTSDTR